MSTEPFDPASPKRYPVLEKFHSQGLATLSAASQLFQPWSPSFRTQHSWASPCKAFLLFRDPKKRFRSPVPLLRFPWKPRDLHPALQRLPPTKKAVSLPLGGLVQGETLAFLGFSSSQALSSLNQRKSVSLSRSPSRSFSDELVTHLISQSLRACPLSDSTSPS